MDTLADRIAALEADGFTVRKTAKEIAFTQELAAGRYMAGMPVKGSLQEATCAASLASGDRIGTSVGQTRTCKAPPGAAGYCHLVLTAYRLGRNGEPKGASKQITLASWLDGPGIMRAMQEYGAGKREWPMP